MNILYLECKMGASGDMLMGALLELLPDAAVFFEEMKCLEELGICITRQDSVKCGIHGTHVEVRAAGEVEHVPEAHAGHMEETEEEGHTEHHREKTKKEDHTEHHREHGHVHRGYRELLQIIAKLKLPERVKKDIASVYQMIAEAEAEVHQTSIDQIHFHEVGSLDALADVTGVCVLMNLLHPDRVITSPIQLGNGVVRCAHGSLPVPAPATASLLKNVPVCTGTIRSELCTPTGAALLKYFTDQFGNMPEMTLSAVGYGMGEKDFPVANCLRSFLGSEYP